MVSCKGQSHAVYDMPTGIFCVLASSVKQRCPWKLIWICDMVYIWWGMSVSLFTLCTVYRIPGLGMKPWIDFLASNCHFHGSPLNSKFGSAYLPSVLQIYTVKVPQSVWNLCCFIQGSYMLQMSKLLGTITLRFLDHMSGGNKAINR